VGVVRGNVSVVVGEGARVLADRSVGVGRQEWEEATMRHDETRQETRRPPYESSSEDERAATKMWGASSAALAGRRRRLRATQLHDTIGCINRIDT
jgi:hypothetical protein